MIYGLYLPSEVLEKVYFRNAEKLLALEAAPENETAKADGPPAPLRVGRTEDFEVTGTGEAEPWERAPWHSIPQRTPGGLDYSSRFKLLASETGLYVLFEASDARLTTTGRKDFENLWEEDVFEVFLWTDESHPVYFEYEISPLGYELPILVPNFGGQFRGWLPWHYEGARKTRKATSVSGGKREPGAAARGWIAEIFIPYELLSPLKNVPPQPGSRWRANFYRVDYDNNRPTRWTWAPVGPSFHEYEKFGTLVFE